MLAYSQSVVKTLTAALFLPFNIYAVPLVSSGGFANGIARIGSNDPIFDSIQFKHNPALGPNIIVLYFEENLTFQPDNFNGSYYSVWENVEFNDSPIRMQASLVGTNTKLTNSLSSGFGFVRSLSLRNLTLKDTDLDTGTIKLLFTGTNNNLTLDNSSVLISGGSPSFSSFAPMVIDVVSGSNTISNMKGNYVPTQLELNIDSGASLEFIDSGALYSSSNNDKLNFKAPTKGAIDGGTLKFNLSNAYFNSTTDFKLLNNATLALTGSVTSAEFEFLDLTESQIDLGRNTSLTINQTLSLTDSDITIASGASLYSDNLIKTSGDVAILGKGVASRIYGHPGLALNELGAPSRLKVNDIHSSDIGYLYLNAGSTIDLRNTDFNVTKELYALGNPELHIHDGAFFNLSGYTNSISNELNITIDDGGFFTLSDGGLFTHENNTNIVNNGNIEIDADYYANGAMSGTGAVKVLDSGRLFLSSFAPNPNSVFIINNPISFSSYFQTIPGGELHTVINVNANLGAENGRLLYGAGDVDLTYLKSLNVSQSGSNTAAEMDGKYFTVVAAQNSGVSGSLTGAANVSIIEASNIPALIDFRVIDKGVVTGKADVTLIAESIAPHQIQHNPNIGSKNNKQVAQLFTPPSTSSPAPAQAAYAALNTITNGQLNQQFSSIHPEPYSSHMTVNLEQAENIMNMVRHSARKEGPQSSGHSAEAPQAPQAETDQHAWFHTNYIDGSVDGDNDLGDFDYDLQTVIIGNTYNFASHANIGFYLAHVRQNMDEHDATAMHFKTNAYHLGGYGSIPLEEFTLEFIAGGAWTETDSKRQTTLGNTTESAKADYDGYLLYTGVNLYRRFILSSQFNLNPFIGCSYIYYSQDSIQESNAPTLGLHIDDADADAVIGSLGLRGEFRPLGYQNVSFAGTLRYDYDFEADRNGSHSINAGFAHTPNQSTKFTGKNRGAHAYTFMLSADHNFSEALRLGIDGMHTYSDDGSELGASLRVDWIW